MAQFTVKPKNAAAIIEAENSVARDLNGFEGDIRSISSSLGFKIAAEYNLRNRLNGAADRVDAHKMCMSSMKSALQDILNAYERTENAILGNQIEQNKIEQNQNIPTDGNNSTTDNNRGDGGENDGRGLDNSGSLGASFGGALLHGKISKHTNWNGTDVGYDAEGNLVHFTSKVTGSAEWDMEKGNVGAGIKGKVGFSAADGEIDLTFGNRKGTLKGSVFNVGAEGAVGAAFFSNGKLAPSLYAKASAEASVAKGEISSQHGSDEFNVHSKAQGTLLGAKAEAEGHLGQIEREDGTIGWGVSGKAGAEAYVAEGSISRGFTVFGVKFDLTAKGKVGGAGVKVGGEATTGNVEGEIGLGLGLGVGLKFSVDWTGFKWPWEK